MKMKDQRQLGFLVARIHQTAGRIFSKRLKELDIEINPAQGRIMFVLWREDRISINELAKRTSLGKSTLTSMLERLEQQGFIKRAPSDEDRRCILIERTQKDRDLEKLYVRVSKEMNDLTCDGFSKKELDRLEKDLERILKNLERKESGKE
jgi:DNA-binding MarR family transcriptional regulator